MSSENSRYDAVAPTLPVIESGLATIISEELAAQYAPEVPMSLISAILDFPQLFLY